jgi:erythritol kinase
MIVIAVDAGISEVRAAAFDDSGQTIASAAESLKLRSKSAGLVETDLETLLVGVYQSIRGCVFRLGRHPDLLAVTAQGCGLWLTDDQGYAPRPPIMWSDSRAAHYVQEWFENGIAAASFRRSGNVPFPGSPAALLRWLADHEPDSLFRSTTAGYCKDVILQRLTGVRVTDASDASLPFLNVRTRAYDEELVDLFRVRPWRHLLAPIENDGGATWALNHEGSKATGLPQGTPVHAGPFNFPATALGAGLREGGHGLIALGTTLACGVCLDRLDMTGEPSGMTICRPLSNQWIRLLPATSGMSALDWLLPLIGVDYGRLNELIDSVPPGANGVLAIPIFSTRGEQAPFVDPHAHGRILGLSTSSTTGDLARAVCEGVAYTARHCLEAGGLGREAVVTLFGGGSRAGSFRQLLADVLNRQLLIARQPETSARGAAMAALDVAGESYDHENWTRPDATVQPGPAATAYYEDGYRRYREELSAARWIWSGGTQLRHEFRSFS